MRCIVCKKTISSHEYRTSFPLWKGPDLCRHIFACHDCQPAFDRLLDSLPEDGDDKVQEPKRAELQRWVDAARNSA